VNQSNAELALTSQCRAAGLSELLAQFCWPAHRVTWR